jgi:hypothetical protein
MLAVVVSVGFGNSLAQAAPGADSLGRDKALALLRTHGLPAFTVDLPIGSGVHIADLLSGTTAANQNVGHMLDAGYGATQRLGYLSFTQHLINLFGTQVVTFDIAPTAMGLRSGAVVHDSYLGYSTEYRVLLAERIPLSVTGIEDQDSTHRSVEFTYRLDHSRPIFSEMVPGGDAVVRSGSATATRYDDGWRITNIQLAN